MKETSQISKCVLLNTLLAFDGKTPLIAAGPLVKEPNGRPYRVVLADMGNQLVVWTEYLNGDPDLSKTITTGSFFEAGCYFSPSELHKAYKRFAIRLKRFAETAESIYRLV